MLNKDPEVTIYFWIIMILCTTVGETAADYLNDQLGLGLTGAHLGGPSEFLSARPEPSAPLAAGFSTSCGLSGTTPA